MFLRNLLICFILSVLFIGCDVDEGGVDIQKDLLMIQSLKEADVKFLHISDTHGSYVSVIPMKDILNNSDCDFGIISGDILPDDNMLNIINCSKKPILLIPGNHDAYDVLNGQTHFRYEVLEKLKKNSLLNFGRDDANYFYVDISKKGKTTRIIGLDQYEIETEGRSKSHNVVMSQYQIDWFIDLLQNSYNVDGIVIIIHSGFGNEIQGKRNLESRNSFISTLAYDFPSYLFYGNSSPFLIPDIIKAYMSGVNILNKQYPSGVDETIITVNTSFNGSHHNFVGYFGGHVHWDLCEYLPYYSNQLQVLMCYSGIGTGKYMSIDYNDLVKTNSGNNSYNINCNLIDYQNKKLSVYRLGANTLTTGGTRDSVQFRINL